MKGLTYTFKIAIIFCLSWCLIVISSPTIASDAESLNRLQIMVFAVQLKGCDCRDYASGKYLSEGDYFTIRTTLSRGNQYVIMGAGDSTVRDLDIILYDENGNEIDRDTQTDATPMVAVSPRWTGTFYIKVKMYRGFGYSNVAICYQ
ncbi:MAG: hypothetical protein HQK60_07080 [Deltaproteobacteria bacterium]|nr:hypothetical protein [Deltaproteobacteria bacterium]